MKRVAKRVLGGAAYVGFGAAGRFRQRSGRGEAPPLSEVRSILAIRVNLLGDLLFSLPAVAALREAAPNARITMAVLPYTADLLRGTGAVDRVVTVDVNGWRRPSAWLRGSAPREVMRSIEELRSEDYDLAVSFYGEVGSAIALASGAGLIVGYESEGYPGAFDIALPGYRYESGRHEAEYCMDLVRALGVAGMVQPAAIAADPLADKQVSAMLAKLGVDEAEPLVALHPGALNMAAKRWLPDRWAAVADRIQEEVGGRVVLVGSSSEAPLADCVRREMRTRPLVLAGRTSLMELCSLLRRSSLFMGGDSGPLHMASSLGVPSVSVYGPTDPANTGPLGNLATVIRGKAPCVPCYDLKRPATCWRGDLLCMSRISVEEVYEAAVRALDVKSGSDEIVDLPPGEPPRLPLHLGEGSGHDLFVAGSAASAVRGMDAHSPSSSTALKRILIVKLAGIGDMLTAFPAMEAIRRKYPLAEITALVTPQSASVLDGAGLVDRVISFDKYIFDSPGGFSQVKSLGRLLRLTQVLRSHGFDAAVLLHHLVTLPGVLKYAALMMGSGAPLRAGLDDGRGRFMNRVAKDRGFGAKHEVDYWLDVAALLGAESSSPAVRLDWGPDEEAFAGQAWNELGLQPGDRVVALHPGTGSYSPTRRWSPGRFAEVGSALAQEGLVPVVVAGPGEEALAGEVAAGIRRGASILKGTPTPRHLGAVLSRCLLFVGNDSGVTHVASAVGVPTVAVFGPSNHLAWAPYDPQGQSTRVVRVDLPCSPCMYRGQTLGLRYGCGDSRCLDQVLVSSVIEAARDLLRSRV